MSAWHRLLLVVAVAVHVWLVWSVSAQPLDGAASRFAPRFATASLHFDAVTWPGPGADFFALYHAGIQARRRLSPYDLQEEPRVTPYFFRYIYSLLLADTLGRLVTLLPPHTAYRVWLVVIEGCLLACLAVLWRRSVTALSKVVGSMLLLLSQPYVLELHMGQFTFVATSLALLGASLVEREDAPHKKSIIAAAFLIMAGLLKTFPFVTLPAYMRHRRGWPPVLGAALALAFMGIWSLVAHRGPAYFAALSLLDQTNGPHPGASSILQASFLMVSAATGVWAPRAFGALPLIVVVALLVWTALRVLRARCQDVVLGSVVMLVAFFLAFLRVWEHHYSAVLLAGVFLLGRVPSGPTVRFAAAPLLVVALVFLAAPSPFALVGRQPESWSGATWLVLSFSKALPTLAVYVIGIRALGMNSSQSPPAGDAACQR